MNGESIDYINQSNILCTNRSGKVNKNVIDNGPVLNVRTFTILIFCFRSKVYISDHDFIIPWQIFSISFQHLSMFLLIFSLTVSEGSSFGLYGLINVTVGSPFLFNTLWSWNSIFGITCESSWFLFNSLNLFPSKIDCIRVYLCIKGRFRVHLPFVLQELRFSSKSKVLIHTTPYRL